MKFKLDSFIIALLLAIGVAYIFPDLALVQGLFALDNITTLGIALIFFFYGLKLSFGEIKIGLKNWRLHVLIQLATFLLFPLLVLSFRPFLQTAVQEQFWLSFFFLAALPSTVSSSVVMVSLARGNMPAAIFNSSISGIIGILVTPMWMGLFLSIDANFDFSSVYKGLFLEILLPIILGLFIQPYWGKWAKKYSKPLANFDKTIILLIVYKSFADSFEGHIFQTVTITYLILVFVCVILVFFLIYLCIWFISRKLLKFPVEDEITAIFCGSKKSLTHGTVFGKFIFGTGNLGLILFPLMVFHAFQIFVVTIIAQKYARRKSL